MTTRHIIVAITPDADGIRCGECNGPHREGCWTCGMAERNNLGDCVRGNECKEAERKLAAIVEAGMVMRHICNSRGLEPAAEAWDRAVAEVVK